MSHRKPKPQLLRRYVEELIELVQEVATDAHGEEAATAAICRARQKLDLPTRCCCCGVVIEEVAS